MENNIKYFYKMEPIKLLANNNGYEFIYNNEKYYLVIYNRNDKIDEIINLSLFLEKQNVLINEIYVNKDNNYLSIIENIAYYLYKPLVNESVKIKLSEISYFSLIPINYKNYNLRASWNELWEKKIDYLESQINEMGKKFPILVESFNYFVGMIENAICYIKNTLLEEKPTIFDTPVLSHRIISNRMLIREFYDPVNVIIDHKARDVSEYIKKSYINGNNNIYNELNEYFKIHRFSTYGIRLLIGRLLYPSYYLELYDQVMTGGSEREILILINKVNEYECFLKTIFIYFKQKYSIPDIEWLIKKEATIPH